MFTKGSYFTKDECFLVFEREKLDYTVECWHTNYGAMLHRASIRKFINLVALSEENTDLTDALNDVVHQYLNMLSETDCNTLLTWLFYITYGDYSHE